MNNFSKLLSFSIKKTERNNFYKEPKNKFKVLCIFWYNFYLEILALVLFNKKKKIFRNLNQCCYCTFPRNWKVAEEKSFRLYKNKNKSFFYLTSFLHKNELKLQNFYLLKSVKKNHKKNVIPIQNYLKFSDILKSYFNKKTLFCLIQDPVKAVTISKNLSLFFNAINFFKHHKIDRIVIPYYELLEGRAVFLASHNKLVKTYPLVHGTICQLTRKRAIDASIKFWKKKPITLPTKVLCETDFELQKFLAQGIHAQKIKSSRLYPIKKISYKKTQKKLVLLGMHLYQKYLYLINKLPKNILKNIVVRPHPSTNIQELQRYNKIKIETKKSLQDSILTVRPSEIWLAGTGCLFELCRCPAKLFFFKIINRQNCDPAKLQNVKLPTITIEKNSIVKNTNQCTTDAKNKLLKRLKI